MPKKLSYAPFKLAKLVVSLVASKFVEFQDKTAEVRYGGEHKGVQLTFDCVYSNELSIQVRLDSKVQNGPAVSGVVHVRIGKVMHDAKLIFIWQRTNENPAIKVGEFTEVQLR
jgi:hypothetical protein